MQISAKREDDLTDDYTKIDDQQLAISSKFDGGRTAVGDAILEGIDAVTEPKHCRPWANNALVLMSDGKHNTGTRSIGRRRGCGSPGDSDLHRQLQRRSRRNFDAADRGYDWRNALPCRQRPAAKRRVPKHCQKTPFHADTVGSFDV